MTETTQDQRDYVKGLADQVAEDNVPLSRRLAYGLANDADRLDRYEARAMLREDLEAQGVEVPEWAIYWSREYDGVCIWFGCEDSDSAPDLRPNEPGPLTLAVL